MKFDVEVLKRYFAIKGKVQDLQGAENALDVFRKLDPDQRMQLCILLLIGAGPNHLLLRDVGFKLRDIGELR